MNLSLPDLAWLLFRAAYSFVFLNAAWQCGKSRAGVRWTIDEASILFGKYAWFFGPAGIVIMGAGGLSILLGFCAEIGGLILVFFLPLGALIHLRQRDRAARMEKEIQASLPAKSEALGKLGMSAQLGHYSSAIKNWSLLGPAIFFAVMGSGPWSVLTLWGLFRR